MKTASKTKGILSKITLLLITFSLMLGVLTVVSDPLVAFAKEEYTSVADYIKDTGKTPAKVKVGYLDGDTPGYTTFEVDGTSYYYKSEDEEAIMKAINGSKDDPDTAITDYTDAMNAMDMSADTDTAVKMMSGFTGVLRTLLGIIVVAISVGMTVYSAFDISYLAFPVFRNKCDEAKASGRGIGVTQNNQTGENKLRFVSDDAQNAIRDAEASQGQKNPFVIYFKKRFLSYLVLAVLLFILLSGRITIFTDLAVRLTQGLIDIISGI